jgi:hypothetical protein
VEVDGRRSISDHFVMPASPRCGALLRNGQPCGRTVAGGSEFCSHHTKLLETIDAANLRQGRIPKRPAVTKPVLRIVSEPATESPASPATPVTTTADPATVRPSLAAAAAENVEALKASLLEAAGSAVKQVWLTVECTGCGQRSRVEAPVPDVRARVAAIELLLREGLGRPATAEEVHAPMMPATVAAVNELRWDEMEALAAAIFVDEIATVRRGGGEALVREKLLALTQDQRRMLRDALLELDVA